MKLHLFQTALNSLLVSATLVSAELVQQYPLTSSTEKLCNACTDAVKRGDDSVIAAIFRSGTVIMYKSGQCIPYTLDNKDEIYEAYLCKPAQCSMFRDTTCTVRDLGDPMPYWAGQVYFNVESSESVMTASAMCERDPESLKIELPTCALAYNIEHISDNLESEADDLGSEV